MVGTWRKDDSDPTDPRNGLLEQLQALADKLRGEDGQPRGIAARPRKAGDEAARHRIATGSEDDGEGLGRLLGGQSLECACRQDDINLELNQFNRKGREPLALSRGISGFDHEVAALDVTEVAQPLPEGRWQLGNPGQVAGQVAYSSDIGRLLGLGGKRADEAPEEKGETEDDPPPRGNGGAGPGARGAPGPDLIYLPA